MRNRSWRAMKVVTAGRNGDEAEWRTIGIVAFVKI